MKLPKFKAVYYKCRDCGSVWRYFPQWMLGTVCPDCKSENTDKMKDE